MTFLRITTFLLLTFLTNTSFSQNLNLDGIISGYNYNPVKGLFKKGSNVLLEGRLDDVSIIAFSRKRLIYRTKTNIDGEFHLELPTNTGYRVEVYKKNYGKIAFNIDLTKVSIEEELNFWSLELILNSYVPKKVDVDLDAFGELVYSEGFYFKEFEQKSNLFSKKIDYNPLISLILESVAKNKPNVFINKNGEEIEEVITDNKNGSKKTYYKPKEKNNEGGDVSAISPELMNNSGSYSNLIFIDGESGELKIADRELLIKNAKKQLEIDRQNAKTPLDSLLIKERELLITAAENELVNLKEIIDQKEAALSLKNTQLILFSIVLVLLIALTFFVLRINKMKTKLNLELKDKNKKITDSIIYAEKIQKAILPDITELNKIIDNSFILFKPKDRVSGDYYWFEQVGDKTIIAAVDCTGHGVPGAFMSMIGNVLMNNIILERNITSPKKILEALNSELQVALRQENSDPFASQDGMDLTICVIDKVKNKMTYSGAMNPIYKVMNGQVEILDVDKRGVGGFDFFNSGGYTETSVNLEKGSQIYMLSDGYMDQFGGDNAEKYNLARFKKLILDCENKTMESQKDIFENSLVSWKGQEEQTDDILVIGISF